MRPVVRVRTYAVTTSHLFAVPCTVQKNQCNDLGCDLCMCEDWFHFVAVPAVPAVPLHTHREREKDMNRQTDRDTDRHKQAPVAGTAPFGDETRLQNRRHSTIRCTSNRQC